LPAADKWGAYHDTSTTSLGYTDSASRRSALRPRCAERLQPAGRADAYPCPSHSDGHGNGISECDPDAHEYRYADKHGNRYGNSHGDAHCHNDTNDVGNAHYHDNANRHCQKRDLRHVGFSVREELWRWNAADMEQRRLQRRVETGLQ
jgi:hypothetical protein